MRFVSQCLVLRNYPAGFFLLVGQQRSVFEVLSKANIFVVKHQRIRATYSTQKGAKR